MDINKQLDWICKITHVFEKHEINYWIDSGVLLSLVRNQKINPWESDVDFGIMNPNKWKLKELKKDLVKLGSRCRIQYFNKQPYTLSLQPPLNSDESLLPIAIHIFYLEGDSLYSPQCQYYLPPPAPELLVPAKTRTARIFRKILKYVYFSKGPQKSGDNRNATEIPSQKKRKGRIFRASQWFYDLFDKKWLTQTWPFKDVFESYIWVIPKELIFPLKEKEFHGYQLKCPHQIEAYLTYRYGEWKTPKSNWYYYRDDGALFKTWKNLP